MSRSGKCSIVTGAGSGFGRGFAKALAAEGSCVVLADKNADGMHETMQMILDAGGSIEKILEFQMDVSLEKDCRDLVEATIKKFNRIDLLINCAGVGLVKLLKDSTVNDFDRIFSVNLKSCFMLSKEVMKHLEKTKGNIVNISSLLSSLHNPGDGIYGAAKAALDHLTKTFAIESGEKGVRVNSVNPTACRTNIFSSSSIPLEEFEKMMETVKIETPMKRVGTIDDVVRAVMFLSSDNASFITAQNLIVDGGYETHSAAV